MWPGPLPWQGAFSKVEPPAAVLLDQLIAAQQNGGPWIAPSRARKVERAARLPQWRSREKFSSEMASDPVDTTFWACAADNRRMVPAPGADAWQTRACRPSAVQYRGRPRALIRGRGPDHRDSPRRRRRPLPLGACAKDDVAGVRFSRSAVDGRVVKREVHLLELMNGSRSCIFLFGKRGPPAEAGQLI